MSSAAKQTDSSDKPTRAGAWMLYMIECRDGSIYTGITIDVAARYAAHAAGKGARYTRAHPPAKLLASIEYPDHSSALKAEYRIKQLTAAEKRAFVSQRLTQPSEDQGT